MAVKKNKARKARAKNKIDCDSCRTQSDCCRMGAWADLNEAKKIVTLGLKGEFFQLEKDDEFPSGYKLGTSYEDDPCTFLDADGLCSIHKISYRLKPQVCKNFPYQGKRLDYFADVLCTVHKNNKKKK
ncbi:MAG: YkgJ family cysteine cluster protein [Candidatus Omnitrophota bacterium]